MKTNLWKTAQWLNALLLVVAVAVAGGCEEPTNPVTAPGEVGHKLAVLAGAANSDREALMALYDATDGENWTDNTNWGSNEDLDEWHGVTTDSDGRVERLVLIDNGLSGSIPAELGGLGNLNWLVFRTNQNLSGSIPAELGNLSELTWLELSETSLSGSIPSELGNLSALHTLAIVSTSVTGGIPPELGNLSSLSALDLRHNSGLSGSIPPELGNLSSLEILYITGNGMSGSIPPELGNLSALRWLYIIGNGLSGSIPSELGNITGLEDLSLDGNQLSGGVPSSLGSLSALTRMHLNQNRLTGAIPNTFLNLRLDELTWWNNESLCVPATEAFRSWWTRMSSSARFDGALCSADRQALLGLHEALDGSNWTNSNWGDDADVRTWRGVKLDSDVRVTELRLGSSGLSGRIPTVLADLDKLRVLVLEGNGLVGEVPESALDLELDVFWWSGNPGLCVPDTEAFRTWLSDMRSISGPICGR